MKQLLILLALAACAYGQTGLGHSTLTCKDIDGDGYGVGPGCLGPDADDSDATVWTAAQTINKWGSINAFLIKQGYQSASSPSTVWCISTTSSGSPASSSNADTACTTPYGSWSAVASHLVTPYIVIFRGGTYAGQKIGSMPAGTSTQQNVIMSYPGEQAVIDYSAQIGNAINVQGLGYITIDGLKILSNASGAGYSGGTYILYGTGSQTITFIGDVLRRCEISGGGTDSNVDADNVTNFVVEENVVHDPYPNGGQHNVYIGSNTVASSGVVVRRNILYNVQTGGYPNLQFNGRCTNCDFESNLLYNADGQEIALLEGVSSSFVRNNLVFNTGTSSSPPESLTIYNYDSGQCQMTGLPSICPWDQTNNVIENNTFWAGTVPVYGSGSLSGQTVAIQNSATTGPCGAGGSPPCGNLGGNFYRNNIIIGAGPVNQAANSGYPPIVYGNGSSPNYLSSDTWTDNIINSQDGSTYIIGFGKGASYGYYPYNCASLTSMAMSGTGCSTASPDFVSVSTNYYNTPASFNFALQPGSPAIAAGTATGAPTYDLWGTTRPNPPSIGAYEPPGECSIAPASLGPWTIGQAINQTFANSGCNSSSWSSSGTWPTGLSFNSSAGILSGTISGSSQTFSPSVGYGAATNPYSITVNPAPSITTSSPLPNGTVGTAYSQSLTASNGTPPLTWSVSSGALPAGTTLSSAGLLSGTPMTAGSAVSFTALVTDSNSVTASETFSVTIVASSSSGSSSTGAVTDLSNTQLQNACPPNNGTAGGPSTSYANYPFYSLCAAQYSAWGSGAIDTARHRLILKGGGHSDYHGNEVYSLNYAASPPTLTRITNPDPWCNIGMPGNTDTSYCGTSGLGIGDSGCSTTSPKDCFENENNTPVARHTFGCLAYLPTQDAIFSFEGTYPSGNGRGFTWWLQFTGNGTGTNASWVAKDPVNGFNPLSITASSTGAMCTYDPLDDTVIVGDIAGTPYNYLWKYNPATNTYTTLSNSAWGTFTMGSMEAAFDPLHNKLWYMGGSGYSAESTFQAGYIDMTGAGSYKYVDESSTLVGTCGGMHSSTTTWPGFEWDPILTKFVGYPGAGNTVYIFDPVGLSCTTETLTGYAIPAIPVINPPSGVFGKFRYTPDIPGNFVYCGGGGVTADCVSMQVAASSQTLATSPCDLNGDGTVNVVDVQLTINQVLGINSCTTADLTGNGQCTVVDVQRVIDASLGGACVTGP